MDHQIKHDLRHKEVFELNGKKNDKKFETFTNPTNTVSIIENNGAFVNVANADIKAGKNSKTISNDNATTKVEGSIKEGSLHSNVTKLNYTQPSFEDIMKILEDSKDSKYDIDEGNLVDVREENKNYNQGTNPLNKFEVNIGFDGRKKVKLNSIRGKSLSEMHKFEVSQRLFICLCSFCKDFIFLLFVSTMVKP